MWEGSVQVEVEGREGYVVAGLKHGAWLGLARQGDGHSSKRQPCPKCRATPTLLRFGHAIVQAGCVGDWECKMRWETRRLGMQARDRGDSPFTRSLRMPRTSFILVMHRIERCGSGVASRACNW